MKLSTFDPRRSNFYFFEDVQQGKKQLLLSPLECFVQFNSLAVQSRLIMRTVLTPRHDTIFFFQMMQNFDPAKKMAVRCTSQIDCAENDTINEQ
jgi:hypothetical protein